MGNLEERLRAVRDIGGKAFIPYVTGGYPGVDTALLEALQEAGADAIEVGIPHSDPVMDGGVIQEASRVALEEHHTRPDHVFEVIAQANLEIPVAVMTYVNPVARLGFGAFCARARGSGVSGCIVPDLPVDEADAFTDAAEAHGIDNVLLAAPGTSDERYAAIGARSHGFVYCVATYGVTGAREALQDTAKQVVGSLRPHTDLPLLVGVGIGTPSQASDACGFADGVIVGSALMRLLLEGDRQGLVDLAVSFRSSIPAAESSP
jgi:tryptophan synthase alpha chain